MSGCSKSYSVASPGYAARHAYIAVLLLAQMIPPAASSVSLIVGNAGIRLAG